MEAREIAEKIADILLDKKGVDLETLHVGKKTTLADYFILVSGTSTPHVKALADEVEFQMKHLYNCRLHHMEGHDSGRWILLDYGDVVVHVFHKEERAYYSLERLWDSSPDESEVSEI